MNIDVIDTHPMDTQAVTLLGKLLNGDIEWLSEQDKSILAENRKAIIQHLNTIFSKEISLLLEKGKCLDRITLFWGLKLAEFLKASETFQWTEKLCHLSIEDLECALGDYFATEELSYLLADTMDQWSMLKNIIENPDINEFIRSACLDALVFSVVKKRIDRLEITNYFKSLFLRILKGELDDELLCTHLASSCSDLWPGECLEEIRESFGVNLIDETHISLDCVLKDYSEGQQNCIEKLQKLIKKHSFWEKLPNITEFSEKIQSEKWDKLLKQVNQFEMEKKRILKEPQRNEICNCGSGKKYKKCCMNKPLLSDLLSNIKIEESIISYGSLEYSDSMKALPVVERESILNLYPLVTENPEKLLQIAPTYIEKYPDIPMLYNFLYGAYRKLKRPREAIKLMKETLRIFPDYLFSRVEYALYLLRRGEPEKAHAALENAGTLSQLYPERKIFHAAEWKAFAYVMSYYWIQKNDLNQAKIYLKIIQKVSSNSHEVKDLQQKMKSKVFTQLMDKEQATLSH